MQYDPSTFTWGYELELGDVKRDTKIPDHLGMWEYCETDVINQLPPYRGLACDPLGIDPPVGGEINTKPTKTWKEQVDKISQILDLFKTPTASCISNGHVHVHVPGLKDDLESLKRLVRYIKNNQFNTIKNCHRFKIYPEMVDLVKSWKTLKNAEYMEASYLMNDSGLPIPESLLTSLRRASTTDDFFMKFPTDHFGNVFRYAINIYNLRRINTIEFRCFRNSIDLNEITNSFKFVEQFINAALNNGPSVEEILTTSDYHFAKFEYNHEMYQAWRDTKYPSFVRGQKKREFQDVQ
jgi:hypothetical protein